MPKLVIIRGIPGCGKSTYAAGLAANGYNIVNRDTLRLLHNGAEHNFSDEPKITAVQDALIDYYLRDGRDVVSDDTNVEWTYVQRIAGIGLRNNAQVEITVLDTPVEVAIARNKARADGGGRDVPETVIRSYYERLEQTKHKTMVGYTQW